MKTPLKAVSRTCAAQTGPDPACHRHQRATVPPRQPSLPSSDRGGAERWLLGAKVDSGWVEGGFHSANPQPHPRY